MCPLSEKEKTFNYAEILVKSRIGFYRKTKAFIKRRSQDEPRAACGTPRHAWPPWERHGTHLGPHGTSHGPPKLPDFVLYKNFLGIFLDLLEFRWKAETIR
jgi:hypothetical protein